MAKTVQRLRKTLKNTCFWVFAIFHFGGVRGGSPAKKIFGLRLCGTHFLSLC